MIDFHTYPVNIKEFLGKDPELKANVEKIFGLVAGAQPLDTFLLKMDVAGIDKAVVLPLDLTTTHGCKLFSNEQIASLCKMSDRFIGFASVDPATKTAVADLKHAVNDLGLKGLKLSPGIQGFAPNDGKLSPLYEACIDLNIPVMLHVGIDWTKGAVLKYSMPLLVEDVAIQYPDLKIVLTKMGWPWVIDTVALLLKYPNVYSDTAGHVVGTPKEHVHFEFLTQLPPSTVENCLREKLVFGSDYPRVWIKTMADAFRSLGLSQSCLDLIFKRNAEKILNLS